MMIGVMGVDRGGGIVEEAGMPGKSVAPLLGLPPPPVVVVVVAAMEFTKLYDPKLYNQTTK